MKKQLLVLLILMMAGVPSFAQRNAVKFTFLGWITGSSKVSYERAFGPESLPQSGELAVGWIGAGGDKYHNNPSGVSLRYGHKFFIGHHSEEKPLKGFFLRPEIIGTRYYYDSASNRERELSAMVAALGCAGYQLTAGHFIADLWFGSGWCTGSPADTGYQHGFNVWNYFSTYNPHIAMSFSIRLGVCF